MSLADQTLADFKLGDEVMTPTGFKGVVEHVGKELLAVRYRVGFRSHSYWWPPTRLEHLGTRSQRTDLDE